MNRQCKQDAGQEAAPSERRMVSKGSQDIRLDSQPHCQGCVGDVRWRTPLPIHPVVFPGVAFQEQVQVYVAGVASGGNAENPTFERVQLNWRVRCLILRRREMTDTKRDQFTESQAFATWVYFLLAGVLAFSEMTVWLSRGQKLILLTSLIWLLPALNLLCLRTRVTEAELIVTFGALFPLYRRRILRSEIASAKPITYRPIPDYGGWGIRGTGRNVALNARGNRGVRLTLQDGRIVLVGSQNAEALAAALKSPH